MVLISSRGAVLCIFSFINFILKSFEPLFGVCLDHILNTPYSLVNGAFCDMEILGTECSEEIKFIIVDFSFR